MDDTELAEEQSQLRHVRKRYLLGVVAIIVLSVALGIFGVIGVTILAILSAVAFLGWSTHGEIRLVDHQRKIAIVNARQEVSDQMDYAAFNVQIVAAKLHLLATLYQQYLAWAPVLGRFLREPFGPQPPAPVPVKLAGLLPRSVGFGVALSDEDLVADAVAELSREVFETGWLSELWAAMVADAPRQLGPQAVDLRSNAQALLSDTVETSRACYDSGRQSSPSRACPRARVTQCGGEHAQRCWRGASMASRSRCSGRSKCKPKRTMVFARRRVPISSLPS